MCNDALFEPPALYTGPTLSPLATNSSTNMPPTITTLSPRIIISVDKLFFIVHKIENVATREWCLIRVAFCDTMSLYLSALQDGQFLVEFYVPHVGYFSEYYENWRASGRASGKKYKAQIVIFCTLLAVNRFSWISWKVENH